MNETEMEPEASPETWRHRRYDIRQIVLTQDFQAVFWHDEGGAVALSAFTIDAIALCDEVTEYRQRVGEWDSRVLEEEVDGNYVAALALCPETGFTVLDESSNYAGMVRIGDALRAPLPRLPYDAAARLGPEFRETKGDAR